MTVFFLLCSTLSVVFSLLLIAYNMHGLAFVGAAAGLSFSVLLTYFYFNFMKKKTYQALAVSRKLFEYWTFAMIACFICSRALVAATPKVMDMILALLWFTIVLCKYSVLHFLKDKRLGKYFPEIIITRSQKKSYLTEAVEWVDAAFYAIFFILLINIFFVQVYRIPSESMVPEFMIGDTVIGFKTSAGPTFPLSSFRLPQWAHYKRGDIVILNNPNYPDTPKERLKTFLSQLIYFLTLGQVNVNTDEYGRQKADPLVKRITGVPGEKLMMVDGILYAKRAEDSDFVPVGDECQYAHWDLSVLPQSEQRLIKDIKISSEQLHVMESVETRRKALEFSEAARQAEALVTRLSRIKHNQDSAESNNFLQASEYELITLFSANDSISRKIVTTNGGIAWFRSFMTGWIPYWKSDNTAAASLYDKRFAQLNALIKLCFGHLIIRNAELFQANVTADAFLNDAERNNLLQEAQEYVFYLAWSNQRNMNVFPAGEHEYIPENCYFMMGDNRFNSTDMRHAYFFHLEPIDKNDALPLFFQSNSAPKCVSASKILGTTVLRIYPFSRFGPL